MSNLDAKISKCGLTIDFKNCYGIKYLKHTFAFSKSNSVAAIYASNGTMKTSFAKTFKAKRDGEEPKELYGNVPHCEIHLRNKPILSKDILVITPFDEKPKMERSSSTLLVNVKLRK